MLSCPIPLGGGVKVVDRCVGERGGRRGKVQGKGKAKVVGEVVRLTRVKGQRRSCVKGPR